MGEGFVAKQLNALARRSLSLTDEQLLDEVGTIEDRRRSKLLTGAFGSNVATRGLSSGSAVMGQLQLLRPDRTAERNRVKCEFVDGPSSIRGLDHLSLEPWGAAFPNVQLRLDGPPSDYFYCGALHLCSPKFQSLLEHAPVEFAPIEWVDGGADGFAALHLLVEAPVIERSLSKAETDAAGWLTYIERLVFDEHAPVPASIFRASKTYEDLVVVTAGFGELLQEQLTGVTVIDPSEW